MRTFDEAGLVMLRKCAVLYMAVAGDTKAQGFDFSRLDKITARTIKTDLIPMIRHCERFNFAQAKERVSTFMSEIMTLSESEDDFLKSFEKGYYKPKLLFDDAEIISRIEHHPMAEWRIRHNRIL